MRNCIILLLLLAIVPKLQMAQRPKVIDEEVIERQKGKTDRGTSVLFLEWNLNRNEIFENNSYGGISTNWGIGYGYFFADRYSFTVKGGLYSFMNKSAEGNALVRDYHAAATVRRYFFKRAAFYVDLGVRIGAYRTMDQGEDLRLVYVTPSLGLGYEYLITGVFPALDNKLGVAVECSTLVPTSEKCKEATALPCFPSYELKFVILYHFNKKN